MTPIAETSIANFFCNYHFVSGHGRYIVFDKIRNEDYWYQDTYDGGEGWANKDPDKLLKEGMKKFLELNEKCKRIQTEEDEKIILEINTPISMQVRNPRYWGKL